MRTLVSALVFFCSHHVSAIKAEDFSSITCKGLGISARYERNSTIGGPFFSIHYDDVGFSFGEYHVSTAHLASKFEVTGSYTISSGRWEWRLRLPAEIPDNKKIEAFLARIGREPLNFLVSCTGNLY